MEAASFIADSPKVSPNCAYPERGRTSHLASSNGKSHPCAMAASCLLAISLGHEDERFSKGY